MWHYVVALMVMCCRAQNGNLLKFFGGIQGKERGFAVMGGCEAMLLQSSD